MTTPFYVSYTGGNSPVLMGNGFDGLRIGSYRGEAKEFVEWLNDLLSAPTSSQPGLVPDPWGQLKSGKPGTELTLLYEAWLTFVRTAGTSGLEHFFQRILHPNPERNHGLSSTEAAVLARHWTAAAGCREASSSDGTDNSLMSSPNPS